MIQVPQEPLVSDNTLMTKSVDSHPFAMVR
jgi:hypothetical protein